MPEIVNIGKVGNVNGTSYLIHSDLMQKKNTIKRRKRFLH